MASQKPLSRRGAGAHVAQGLALAVRDRQVTLSDAQTFIETFSLSVDWWIWIGFNNGLFEQDDWKLPEIVQSQLRRLTPVRDRSR